MKVREEGEGLTVKIGPSLGGIIFGTVFVLIGVLAPLLVPIKSYLECDKGTMKCTHQSANLLWSKQIVFNAWRLKDIKREAVETENGKSHVIKEIKYHYKIDTGQGIIKFPFFDLSELDANTLEDNIKGFIMGDNKHLEEVYETKMFLLLFVFALAGLITIVAFGRSTTCVIDKGKDIFMILRKGIFTKRNIELKLSKIRYIGLARSVGSKGSSTFRVVLYTADGDEVPLTSYYSSGFNSHMKVAKKIADYIGLDGVKYEDALIEIESEEEPSK